MTARSGSAIAVATQPVLGVGTPETIVGRDQELAAVERFLAEILLGPVALVLEGDAGAGKTTIWRAAVAAGEDRGYRVLTCNPSESERSLAFAALSDLIEGVLDETELDLPAPQDRALKVATLMADPEGPPPDQRAVSAATLGVLRALSERSPVLVAIDNVQWIDRASGRVLDFALRRLHRERVGVVVSARPSKSAVAAFRLDEMFGGQESHHVAMTPLDPDSLDAIYRAKLGTSFPLPLLTQIAAASGGNPLFALEIGREILRGEIVPRPGEPLSVPGTLHQLVRERLADLPTPVRDLLLIAAAVSEPTIAFLENAATSKAEVADALDVAVRAGAVDVFGDRVRFTHPLFASALYHAVGGKRRRAMHRSLVGLVTGSDERARHLALGAEGPDAAVATALDLAAHAAANRGAPDAAAALSEQASRLTPLGDEAAGLRRRTEAAEYHFAAGDPSRARQLLEEIATTTEPGPVRASILRRLAKVRYRSDSCSVAAQLLGRALDEAGDGVSLRAGIGRDLAWAVTLCGDVRDAAEHAQAALELVYGSQDVAIFSELLAATTMTDFLLGQGINAAKMRRSLELERPRSDAPIEWRPSMMRGMMLKWSGDLDGAGRSFDELHRRARELAEETSLPFLLSQMSETATWTGNFGAALQYAEEAHTIALQTGQELIRSNVLYTKALAEAHLGRVDEARKSARAGLELGKNAGSVLAMMLNQTVLGFVELSVDNAAGAHSQLAPLVAWSEVVGIREPGVLRFMPDEVEALVALGKFDKADRLLTNFEADARRLERPWAILAAARCRALHTAATGDVGHAAASLQKTLEATGKVVPPFERARAFLVLGSVERRTRRRKGARLAIDAALEIFEPLGASLWSDRTRRMSTTNTRHLPGELTEAERRVAELVAGGATNRETADRLFVSVRAVEVHLTSVYRKLGIRSRTELARRIAPRQHDSRCFARTDVRGGARATVT